MRRGKHFLTLKVEKKKRHEKQSKAEMFDSAALGVNIVCKKKKKVGPNSSLPALKKSNFRTARSVSRAQLQMMYCPRAFFPAK